MQMLTIYRRLFSELEQQAAEYAVWKNSQELPEALLGSGDIDLYVYPGSRQRFLAVLRKLRFVCLRSHKAFPCVEHYYGYDEKSGKFAHLHCYFRMVTGESHIKQYVVPIEPYLKTYAAVLDAQGVRSLHPVLQKKLNIFRRKIKLSCLPGALLFFRERQGYRLEREMTTSALAGESSDAVKQAVFHGNDWLHDIKESSSIVHEVVEGLQYRFRFQHWNRFSPWLTPFHRYFVILLRLHGKVFKRKKLFPVGLTLAVSGVERASIGKHPHTLTYQWMKKHFSVYTLATPPRLDQLSSSVSMTQDTLTHSIQGLSPQQLVELIWDARCWRNHVRRSVRLSTAGFIVFWDPSRIEKIRCAISDSLKKHPGRSWIRQRVLQMSYAYLQAEPLSDAGFLVGYPQNDEATIGDCDESSLPGVGFSNPEATALRTGSKFTAGKSEGVMVEATTIYGVAECTNFKTTLWETIVDLQ
ncbi:MAG: hypothetical protein AB8B97_11770 [Granulosicoccus sp.]